MVHRKITFFTSHYFVLQNESLVKIDIPEDARFRGFFKNMMLIELKSDWKLENITYKQGMLLSIDFDEFMSGERNFEIIFEPEERITLVGISKTKNFLLLSKLSNVKSELVKCFHKLDYFYLDLI